MSSQIKQPSSSQVIEELENRILCRAPRPVEVVTDFLDNRGTAFLTFSQPLDKSTLSRKTAAIYLAGTDGVLGTADDLRTFTTVSYSKGRMSLSAAMAINTPYRVKLNSSIIKDINGLALDGEFNGEGAGSGNGAAGGDYDVKTVTPRKLRVRFWTTEGYINVGLFNHTTPNTVDNFLHYANEGAWDQTFFHRSEHATAQGGLDIIQGGGFISSIPTGDVHQHTGIPLELGNSNVQGTIAMARTSDPNSATNQWFFNTKSNTVLDTTGGGYTVFGAVLDAESLATITRINNYKIIDAASSGPLSSDPNAGNFSELPVTDSTITASNVTANFFANITRVGQLFDAGATFPSGAQRSVATPAAAQATQAVVVPPTAAATAFSTAGPKRNPLFDDAE